MSWGWYAGMVKLDEDAIQHLANIAQMNGCEWFGEGLKRIIANAWTNVARAGGADATVPVICPEAVKQLKKADKAMRKSVEALDALDNEAASFFAWAISADEMFGLEERIEGGLRFAINDAMLMVDASSKFDEEKQLAQRRARATSAAIAYARQQALDAMNKRSAPAGEAPNPKFSPFDWLIAELLLLVRSSGRLTFNPEYSDSPGTLWDFYQDLLPYLPSEFPREPNLSRLRRLKETWQK